MPRRTSYFWQMAVVCPFYISSQATTLSEFKLVSQFLGFSYDVFLLLCTIKDTHQGTVQDHSQHFLPLLPISSVYATWSLQSSSFLQTLSPCFHSRVDQTCKPCWKTHHLFLQPPAQWSHSGRKVNTNSTPSAREHVLYDQTYKIFHRADATA